MRFVLIYLYKSDCGKSGAAFVYEFVKSLRLVVFLDFKAFHCVLLRDFRILLYIGVFTPDFGGCFSGFELAFLPFCAVFRYKREKFSAVFVLCRKMMRSPVCRDENSHRFCAENVIYLLYHNTAKITIKTPRLDDGCRPNRPPPPDFSLCKLSISRPKISCAENCRKCPQNGTLSHKTACF